MMEDVEAERKFRKREEAVALISASIVVCMNEKDTILRCLEGRRKPAQTMVLLEKRVFFKRKRKCFDAIIIHPS